VAVFEKAEKEEIEEEQTERRFSVFLPLSLPSSS
jgi:hypothetical protein